MRLHEVVTFVRSVDTLLRKIQILPHAFRDLCLDATGSDCPDRGAVSFATSDQGESISAKAKCLARVQADIEHWLRAFRRLNRDASHDGMPLDDFLPDDRKIMAGIAPAVAGIKQLPR